MNDEFKKLDQFIQKNIPDTNGPLKPLIIPQKNLSWLKGFAVCASLLVVVAINQNKRQFNESEGMMALEEVMMWDMAADESVSEIDDVIEFIE